MGLFQTNDDSHACPNASTRAETFRGGSHARCVRDARPQVIARPEFGCEFWVRAIGADDNSPQRSMMA